MKSMKKNSLEDLEFLQECFQEEKDVLGKVQQAIQEKKSDQESINTRFDMALFEKLQVFDPWEIRFLKQHHIMNLQELIDCPLESLIGMTPSLYEKFNWARHFYDLRSMVKEREKQKK